MAATSSPGGPAYEALLPRQPAVPCCSKRSWRILISDFVYWQIRVGIWLMGLILGYRNYEPKPDSLALCVHTNGMGHVIQMLRILDVLNAASIRVSLITIPVREKIPQHFLVSLREKVGPDTEIVDLNHEVHYDDNNGAGINNLAVVLEAGWKIFGPDGWRTVRQCLNLLMKHKPQVCLSLWDPHLPLMIDAFGAKTSILQVATQAIMYEDGRGHDLVLDMLYLLNVSRKGELLPLVFSPQPGSMPIVCEVPPLLPSEPYLVAYSCMPSVLTPLSAIKTHKVVLFAKNVEKWADYYKDCPNVSVQPVGATFQLALAKSSGLIASPSPGAVIQALGCAKPCYLFIPPGHLEQTCNYNYYTKHFIGVASPLTENIEGWADRALAAPLQVDANTAKACLNAAVGGKRLEASQAPPMLAQAYRVRDWLNLFDDAAHRTLIRSLRRLQAPAGACGRVSVSAPSAVAVDKWPAASVAPGAQQV